jgi:hypothetical protein
MITNLGEKKALAWISSGLIPKRPDPITGSTDDDLAEWHCPQGEDIDANREEIKLGMANNKVLDKDAAVEEVEQLLNDVSANSVDSLAALANKDAVDVKTEPIEANPEKQTISKLKALPVVADTKGQITNLREMEIELKLIQASAASKPYAAVLHTDVQSLLKKLPGTIKTVEKLLILGQLSNLNVAEVERLDAKVKDHNEKYSEIRTWAARFGIASSGVKKWKAHA